MSLNGKKRDEERWEATLSRDPKHDGLFVYAVKTTGIYCRPSCPSRRPRQENVEFFSDNRNAERAGYRACKRCRPRELSADEKNRQRIQQVCQVLADPGAHTDLASLAEAVGLSKFHLQRLFKSYTGLTPKQYGRTLQDMAVRETLIESESVTTAIYAAGFESTGRFYERASALLGMSAQSYRKRGKNQSMWFVSASCDLGRVIVAGTSRGISSIRLGEDEAELKCELESIFSQADLFEADEALQASVAHVLEFLDAPHGLLELPLDVQGTVFQRKVWDALKNIPFGETTTYSALARKIGQPRATRAVANACASNPIAVAIPCHRVLRSDGGLGGYRWGLERKRKLLAREAKKREK